MDLLWLVVLFCSYICCPHMVLQLVDTIHFMETLNLKDTVEKDTFFRKLPNLAEQLPRPIVLKKVWHGNSKVIYLLEMSLNASLCFCFLVSTVSSIISFCTWIWFSCCPCFGCLVENGFLAFDRRIQFQGHALSVHLQYPYFQMLIFVL